MSLVEFFPPQGTGGGGGASTGANNLWSGTNTFDGEVDIDGALTVSGATLTLNGLTQTIVGATSLVRVSGSTASSTVALPAAPIADQIIRIDNQASVSWTLSGNGVNVDGAASKTVAAAGPVELWYSGAAWESLTWAQYSLDVRYPQLAAGNSFSGTATFQSTVSLNAQVVFARQTFSATGNIGVNSGSLIAFTGNFGGTLTLPSSSLHTGMIFIVKDEGGSAATYPITITAGGTVHIDGGTTASISTGYGSIRLYYNGSAWMSW